MMLPCLNPLPINVFPRGSKINKDGSPGCFLSFGCSNVLPEHGSYYRPFAVYGDDTPFTIDTHEGSIGYIVPCGRCVNCRRNKSFRWSRRLLMECDGYKDDEMQFLTLTYDDAHLPSDHLLHYEDVQSFLKRLRKYCPSSLRFFCCGEYGDLFDRPHFHLILFGYDFFTGSKVAGYGSDGKPLFHHPMIDKAWSDDKGVSFGFAEFGDVSPASIQYVAGYVTKKMREYDDPHEVPPFIRMSLKPGIGRNFLLKNLDTILRDKGFYLRGKFYSIDMASVRFLTKECGLNADLRVSVSLHNEEVARILEYQYILVTDKYKKDVDKTLAMCYSIRDRLGNIYGKKTR